MQAALYSYECYLSLYCFCLATHHSDQINDTFSAIFSAKNYMYLSWKLFYVIKHLFSFHIRCHCLHAETKTQVHILTKTYRYYNSIVAWQVLAEVYPISSYLAWYVFLKYTLFFGVYFYKFQHIFFSWNSILSFVYQNSSQSKMWTKTYRTLLLHGSSN